MQAPKISNDSYFLGAFAGRKFNAHMDKQLKGFRTKNSAVNWWSPQNNNNKPLHCTLGLCFSTNKALKNPLLVARQTADILNNKDEIIAHFKGYKISQNGWIILKLKQKPGMQKIHNTFINNMTKIGYKPSTFSGPKFTSHISIGSIKPNANPQRAQKEVDALLNKLQKQPYPFSAFDIRLERGKNGRADTVRRYTLAKSIKGDKARKAAMKVGAVTKKQFAKKPKQKKANLKQKKIKVKKARKNKGKKRGKNGIKVQKAKQKKKHRKA